MKLWELKCQVRLIIMDKVCLIELIVTDKSACPVNKNKIVQSETKMIEAKLIIVEKI